MSIFDELREGVRSPSAAATRALGRRLAGELPADCTLALAGDLGTGKTTLVQGLAEGFGVADRVTSPTFQLYHLYVGRRWLLHLDAYRLTNPAQVEGLLLDEFLRSPFCLAVEWPERVRGWLPTPCFWLELTIEAPGCHRLRYRGSEPPGPG